MLHMTAVGFRQHYDGEGMLQRFREELMLPYLEVLRGFTPLSSPYSEAQEWEDEEEVAVPG